MKKAEPTQAVLRRYAYAYDPAGNRTVEQIDDQVTGATYDNLNRLVSQQPAGGIVVAGAVSESAAVTVQGAPVVVTPGNTFRTTVPIGAGANTVTIGATDPSGNAATRQYEIDSAGSSRTFTFEANGNLTSDGTRTFEWDARNQLVAVNVGTHRGEFTYDGLQRRVRLVEKENGVAQSDSKVVWCDGQVCEERATDGTTVTRRAFRQGEQVASSTRFFAADHLGSVGEVTDSSSTLLARHAFDPWGRRTVTAGGNVTSVGFGGYLSSGTDGPLLARFRAYDPELGRWLSEDPVEDSAVEFTLEIERGINLIDAFDDNFAEADGYLFVRNQPLTLVDLDGLYASCTLLEQRCVSVKRDFSFGWTGIRYIATCVRRKCVWRCYHEKTQNCYNIPCTKKGCQLDHGVTILRYFGPDPTKPGGAAPLCRDVTPK